MRTPVRKIRSAPLGRYLAALVCIVVMPILFTALILGGVFISLERDKMTSAALNAAQGMASQLDNEMNARLNVLQALATSPVIDTHDFELFQRQAEAVGKNMRGVQIVLRDNAGQEIVNSSFVWGNSLARTRFDTDALAAKNAAPVIFMPPEMQGGKVWALIMTYPVMRNDQPAYYLDLSIDVDAMQDFFGSLKFPQSWAWGIFDSGFHRIAGSTQDGNGVLHFASLFDKASDKSGSYKIRDNAGEDALVAYARSQVAGWKIAVVVPKRDMEGPLKSTLSALGLLLSAIATAAIIAVVIINSRLRKSAQRLVAVSRELGHKEIVDPVLTGVKEFDRAAEAISAASISLREKNMVIRDSENRIRTLLDNLFVYVGLLDLNGRMVEANATPMSMAGLNREDVIGRFIWDTYWWNWSPHVKELMEKATIDAREGRTSRFEVEMRMSGGALHTIDFQLAPLRDKDGHISYLLPSAVDVTERKALEHKLQESLAQIEAMYAATPMPIFLMDTNLRFVAVNPKFAAVGKMSIDEHLGKSLREIMGEDGKQLEVQLRKVIKTAKPITKFEYTVTPDEGERTTRVYRASYYPVLNEQGKVQGIAGAVQDLTEGRAN